MKMTSENYEAFKLALEPVKASHPDFAKSYKASDISPKQCRWDVTYVAKATPFICNILYRAGLNDDHIDTALKAIMREWGWKWAAGK